MKFYRFWARSTANLPQVAFGYSDQSLADAVVQANAGAERRTAIFRAGGRLARGYDYDGGRPLREEIVDEFAVAGEVQTVITRNSYGALILNSANVFFADIDTPPPKRSLFGTWFQKNPPDQLAQQRALIQAVVERHSGLGVRLYRTAAGLRCLVRTAAMESGSAASLQLLRDLHSDPLYVRLCTSQRCFRARLTPKPWRMGMPKPPDRYPYRTAASEQQVREWIAEYDRRRGQFATCSILQDLGESATDATVLPVMQLHDHFVCAGREPLA